MLHIPVIFFSKNLHNLLKICEYKEKSRNRNRSKVNLIHVLVNDSYLKVSLKSVKELKHQFLFYLIDFYESIFNTMCTFHKDTPKITHTPYNCKILIPAHK